MQGAGLLNDDWIETQYFVGGHPRCHCLYVFTLGIWVSPERSLPISNSGVDSSGRGSGNSVRVRAWGSHYSIFRLSFNHFGNTCFQPLFSLNLGTLSGLKIKDIFGKARFQKQITVLSALSREVVCLWWAEWMERWLSTDFPPVFLISFPPLEPSVLPIPKAFCDSSTIFLPDF